MTAASPSIEAPALSGPEPIWRTLFFRVARVFLLVLIIIMPLEAVTAAREIALVASAFFLALHLYLSGDRRLRPTIVFWPLALYVFAAVLSLVWAVDAAYSLRELRGEVLKGLIVFYTAVHFVRCPRHLAQGWGALLVGAAAMSLAGIVIYFIMGGDVLHHYVRAGSLHSGYGSFGTYLVTVWPFLLLAPRAFAQSRWRRACQALIPLAAFCGYLTFSRGTWAGMVVETLLCLVMISRRRWRTALVGLGLATLLLLGALALVPGSNHGERWGELTKDPSRVGGTAGDLMAVWKHSWNYISRHPLQGIGLGRHSFSKKFPRFRRTHQPLLWHSHNMFIETALQMGLQGLVALLWLFITLVVVFWPREPPPPGRVVGLFGGALAVMVIGFSIRNLTDDFFVDDSALLFWLLAGLALGARYLGPGAEAPGGEEA